MIGTIKFFDEQKGYGFILVEDEKDFFVHITNVVDKKVLQEGQKVSFEAGPVDKGPKAINVKIIDEDE